MPKILLVFLPALMFALVACTPANPMLPTPTPSNPAPAAGKVAVWVTYPDQSKKLQREPDLEFTSAAAGENKTISVDESTQFQQMEGFGAAMTDSSAWLMMKQLDPASRDALMHDLFTRDGGGIGLSFVRVPMGASDFSLEDYTYDDMQRGQQDTGLRRFNIEYDKQYILPALRQAAALNPQLRFLGSPWSAPAWMKTSHTLNGGSLSFDFYQAFADYHVRFVQAYADEGLKIDAVTPQNEPLNENSSYPTMGMSAEGQQAFVRDYMGPAFEKAGLETRIIIFDHNWDLAAHPLTVLSDPKAAAFVDGVAFHCYGGDVAAQSTVHRAYPDKGIWFTECSGGGWATDFGGNLGWNLDNLVIGNFRNWGNSLMLWNLALDQEDGPQNGGCGDCRGVVTINTDTGKVKYNEEYYILGHVSKFVDPGAFRIDSSSAPKNVAFINPDGSLVLIVRADGQTDFNVSWRGESFSYSLPAGAVATFVWNKK